MKFKNSISFRLSVILTITVIIVSSAFILFNYYSIKKQNERDLRQRADEYIEVMATSLSFPLWNYDKETAINMVTAFALNDLVVSLSLFDSSGNEIVLIDKARKGEEIERFKQISYKNYQTGSIKVIFGSSIYDAMNRRMLIAHSIIIIFIVVFLIIASNIILRVFLKMPLQRLDTVAKAYAIGNYNYPISEEPYTEFQQFMETMKEMGSRILEQMHTIHDTEAKFKNMFENTNDGIFQISAEWKDIQVNPALAEILGYEASEEIRVSQNQSAKDVFAASADFREIIDHFQHQGQIINLEKRIHRQDGELRWVLISGRAVTLDGDKIEYYEGSVIDITNRKLAEEELASLKQYLNSVVDSMPSILVGINANAAVTLWNKHAESATGISYKNAINKPVTQLFPEFATELNQYTKAIQENSPQSFEKIKQHRNGDTDYVDVLIYPLKLENNLGAVVRIDNVTQRVKIEQMMIQTEKIISVGGLAAGMAHEINNPLGVIMMAVQNLDRRLSPDNQANSNIAEICDIDLVKLQRYVEERKINKLIDSMKSSILRASKIITNMLHYSRRSESKMAFNDINRICEHAIELANNDYDLKKEFDFRKIKIIKEFDQKLSMVPCTETEIEQVILNLLRNSAYAMNEMPKDHQRIIMIKTAKMADMAQIEIEDTGPGMDEETQNRIFEPFFTTKPAGRGTGLGLSVSYMIVVSNHQGSFEVQSRLEHGTKFIIRLPLTAPSSEDNEQSTPPTDIIY